MVLVVNHHNRDLKQAGGYEINVTITVPPPPPGSNVSKYLAVILLALDLYPLFFNISLPCPKPLGCLKGRSDWERVLQEIVVLCTF